MAEEPFYQRWWDSFNDTFKGRFQGTTKDLAKSIEQGTSGKIKAADAETFLPIAAAIAVGGAGYAMSEPMTKLGRGVAKLTRNVITGFGLFEKIPLIGGIFRWAGRMVDSVSDSVGTVLTGIGSFLAYKLFQVKPEPPRIERRDVLNPDRHESPLVVRPFARVPRISFEERRLRDKNQREKIKQLTEKLDKEKNRLTEEENRIKEAREKLTGEGRARELRQQALDARANELFRQRQLLNQNLAELAKLEAEGARLTEALQKLQTSEAKIYDDLTQNRANAAEEYTRLEAEVAKHNAECEIYENRVRTYDASLLDQARLTAANESVALEKERLRTAQEELKTQREKLEAEKAENKTRNDAEIESLRQQEAALEAERAKFATESAAELSQLKERAEALKEEAAKLQKAKDEFNERQAKAQKDLESRETQLSERAAQQAKEQAR
ncbi:MAG: hypothetical protein K2Q01_12205, partial [Rickettsiales bacterium]|nr:hypothetical protein [Rickettsiales bacterium]